MTRGQRAGFLKNDVLAERIRAHIAAHPKLALPSGLPRDLKGLKRPVLLAAAYQWDLFRSPSERIENSCFNFTTQKCYLRAHVKDDFVAKRLDEYAERCSLLFRRGSILANLCAIRALKETPDASEAFRVLEAFLMNARDLKQCFLPERWDQKELDQGVLMPTLQAHGVRLAHLLPDWKEFMSPSGWDNCLADMAKRYAVNLVLHVRQHFDVKASKYLGFMFERYEAASGRWNPDDKKDIEMKRGALAAYRNSFSGGLRPLVIGEEAFDRLIDLRSRFYVTECGEGVPFWDNGCRITEAPAAPEKLDEDTEGEDTFEPKVRLDPQDLALHVHLVREAGVASLLPVASIGRKAAYLDLKIARFLFKGGPKALDAALKAPDTTLGCALGLVKNPDDLSQKCPFGARRAQVRRTIRCRKHNMSRRACAPRKEWRRRGHGTVPKDARVHSLLTDGVSLCMRLQRPKKPLSLEKAVEAHMERERKTKEKKAAPKAAAKAAMEYGTKAEEHFLDASRCHAAIKAIPTALRPVIAGQDGGRSKITTTHLGTGAPGAPSCTVAFTRHQYLWETRYKLRTQWEKGRASQPEVKEAIEALGGTGGIRNATEGTWVSYLETEAKHWDALRAEYLNNTERALWSMRLYRWKTGSRDRSVQRVIQAARRVAPEAHGADGNAAPPIVLIVALGDARFASSGKGEIAVPTTGMERAYVKAKRRLESGQSADPKRRRIIMLIRRMKEFRTTVCCHKCGVPTYAPLCAVRKGDVNCSESEAAPEEATYRRFRSRRLRVCPRCSKSHASADRQGCDRDCQAAKNIRMLEERRYYGAKAPWYFNPSEKNLRDQFQNMIERERAGLLVALECCTGC